MKLLIFSDIHSDLKTLEKLVAMDADHYIAAGDLVNWGRHLDACGKILKARGQKVHVIPGNHESAEQITGMCEKFGLHDLHGRRFEAGGFHVIGLGYSNPTPFGTPGEYAEDEIEARMHFFDGLKPTVAIVHCPPYGNRLDRINGLRHVGSTALRDFVIREQPRYLFCGHIHQNAGVAEKLGETSAMNVGPKGYLLDLSVMEAPDFTVLQDPSQYSPS